MEHSIGSIISKIDAVLSKMDTISDKEPTKDEDDEITPEVR